jgi:hypothetical protein
MAALKAATTRARRSAGQSEASDAVGGRLGRAWGGRPVSLAMVPAARRRVTGSRCISPVLRTVPRVVLPATPFLFFFFLLKTKANLKLQNLEFENSDQHETNFVGKRTKIWKLVGVILYDF